MGDAIDLTGDEGVIKKIIRQAKPDALAPTEDLPLVDGMFLLWTCYICNFIVCFVSYWICKIFKFLLRESLLFSGNCQFFQFRFLGQEH